MPYWDSWGCLDYSGLLLSCDWRGTTNTIHLEQLCLGSQSMYLTFWVWHASSHYWHTLRYSPDVDRMLSIVDCGWGGGRSRVCLLVALKCTRHLWKCQELRYMWVASKSKALVKFWELTVTEIHEHAVYNHPLSSLVDVMCAPPLNTMCTICFQTHSSSALVKEAERSSLFSNWCLLSKCIKIGVWIVNGRDVWQANRLPVELSLGPANDHSHTCRQLKW